MKKNLTLGFLFALGLSAPVAGQDTDLADLDSDSNGKVSLAEFQEYVAGKLPGFDQLEDFAKKVDTNGDGNISQAEFDVRIEKLAGMQEEEAAPEDGTHEGADEAIDAAVKAYKKISDLVGENDWDTISSQMTKKAADDFCFEITIGCLAFAKMDMGMEIPGLSDSQDEILEAVEVFGLDKLDIDVDSMIQMKIDDGSGVEESESEEDEKSPEGKRADQKETILAALDKDGKRWEIVAALCKAQSSSPFLRNPLRSKIESQELDGEVCFLTISGAQEDDQDGGVQIQIVSPPTVIRMEKMDDSWKYAGRDEERTQKEMKKFMEKMQSGGPGRTDF